MKVFDHNEHELIDLYKMSTVDVVLILELILIHMEIIIVRERYGSKDLIMVERRK